MDDERLWDDLLWAIDERQVIPIIGDQIMTVETADGPRLFLELVAERLAPELEIDPAKLPPRYLPNDVVFACSQFDAKKTSRCIAHIIRTLNVEIPEPLSLLAEIRNFGLFISTSCDTLLESAINQVRGEMPAVATFPAMAGKQTDFDDVYLENGGAMVFQILGRVSATSSFAVTEGQMLEQMHRLLESTGRPKALIEKLKDSHLLIIGVDLPDWLSRFLVRMSRANPLWCQRDNIEYVIGGSNHNTEFGDFMRHFSQWTIIVDSTPTEFVRELHRRWLARHPGGVGAAPAGDTSQPPMAPGSIFVSYASEDRNAAIRLADDLSSAGLEVWIDREITPGDNYQRLIDQRIRKCGAFIPIISRHTQTAEERYFRREWRAACERQDFLFASGRSLLFPVVIDDTPYDDLASLEKEIFKTSAVRAPGGAPPANLIAQLNKVQQICRKEARQ